MEIIKTNRKTEMKRTEKRMDDRKNTYDDFNRALGDLGRDVKSLEETGLLRTHTSVLSFHDNINRGNSSGSSRGSNLGFRGQVL